MNERVVEILVYIMSEFRSNKTNPDHLELISRDLLKRGYTQHEISFAFSWLFERYKGETEELISNTEGGLPGSYRVLHEIEKLVISPEAYGYLLQLRQLNIMNDIEIENVIERAMMVGATHISADEIKALVATMLFSPEGTSDQSFYLSEGNDVIH